jgi:hypothetical protein
MPCGLYARPVVNGVRAEKEMQMGSCFATEVIGALAGIKNGGISGSKPWSFKLSRPLADTINRLIGQPVVRAGEPSFSLEMVLKLTP